MTDTSRSPTSLKASDFYKKFLSESRRKRYLLGINEYSSCIAREINIDGFIDDYTESTAWMDRPIVRISAVESDSLIVSCVTANRSVTALRRLHQAGNTTCCDYFSFADASEGKFSQVAAVTETRKDYKEHAVEYQWIRKQLYDEESQYVFDRIMQFRLEADLQPMKQFEYAAERQYFEPFLQLVPGEVFVDGGGFDGLTTLEFAARCPNYSAVHFFEPSVETLATAKNKLSCLERVYYYPLGLYDAADTLHFDSSSGSASSICEDGEETIQVARLDDVIQDAVSFIKLDLEGAEIAALKGMEQHILTDHPKLAVAVYHRASDFWRIPQYILGLRDDYKVYLRHYTEGWTETVMFFIPR
ncbi:Methyltransferase FkbM domain-containing protein [Candidatus Electronema halotolerans]